MLLKIETKITNLTFPHLLTVVSHVNSPFCPRPAVNQLPSESTKLLACLTLTITSIISTWSLGWFIFLINNTCQTERPDFLVDHAAQCCRRSTNNIIWIHDFKLSVVLVVVDAKCVSAH